MPVSSTIRNLQSLLDTTSPETSPRIPGAYPKTEYAKRSKRRPSLGIFANKVAAFEPLDEWQQPAVPVEEPQASTSQLQDAVTPGIDLDALDEAVNAVFYQAGITAEGLPLLVMCPCNLPRDNTMTTSILDRLTQRLEPFVSAPYVLVFFASPTSASLSTTMLIQRYVGLSRSAKKNVKRLYIVHPGFWTKMIMRLFLNGIVSSKVNKKGKLKAVSSLSELAKEVDITLIEIPPLVYQHDLKIDPTITLPEEPTKGKERCFGVRLADLMGADGQSGLPKVVKDCLALIRSSGLECEGLFRVSPSATTLRTIKEAYDRGHPVNLARYDVMGPEAAQILAASLLKTFLRELPTPILTAEDYVLIDRCPQIGDSDFDGTGLEVVEYIRDKFLPALAERETGQCEVILMAAILQLLHEVSIRSATNKMDAYNLAVVMAPVFLRSDDLARDVSLCHVAGSNPFSSKTSSPMKFKHKHKASRSSSRWSDLLNTDKTSFGSMLRIMISRYHEIFPSVEPLQQLMEPINFPDTPIHTPELSSSTTTSVTTASSLPPLAPISAPASPLQYKTGPRQRTLTRGSITSNVTSAKSISPSTNGSILSFGVASGKASLKLMQKGGTISRRANAEATALSALGLFDTEGQEKTEVSRAEVLA